MQVQHFSRINSGAKSNNIKFLKEEGLVTRAIEDKLDIQYNVPESAVIPY